MLSQQLNIELQPLGKVTCLVRKEKENMKLCTGGTTTYKAHEHIPIFVLRIASCRE